MPPGLVYDLVPVGAEPAEHDLEGIASRMLNAEPAFTEVERILEHGEQRLFTRLRGRYVDTGATKASLTQPTANDAIRQAHANELVFGTRVWYAQFLRKPRSKKSAVLVLMPTERKAIRQTVLDHIMGR
jgi:hypothetical protein